jgi:hypothetical protein
LVDELGEVKEVDGDAAENGGTPERAALAPKVMQKATEELRLTPGI